LRQREIALVGNPAADEQVGGLMICIPNKN
jgi:hypothetical protein